MRILYVFAFFLGMPVSAQDIVFSEREIVACIESLERSGDADRCAGQASKSCIEATPDGYTTVGMGACMGRELDFWDAMLNENYQGRIADAKRADTENIKNSPNLPSQEEALRHMQRAWVTFRDAACDYERSLWGGGTGGGPATMSCLVEITAKQVVRLNPWIDG